MHSCRAIAARSVFLVFISLVVAPAVASAQQSLDLASISFTLADAATTAAVVSGTAVQTRAPVAAPAPAARVGAPWTSKPLRVTLFGSFVALQALDAASTMMAIRAGGVESNPIMGSIASNPAALIAVKSAATFSTLAIMQRISKDHPKAAILLASVLDSAYVAIVANNFRVAAR